jgi:hypothetical protein
MQDNKGGRITSHVQNIFHSFNALEAVFLLPLSLPLPSYALLTCMMRCDSVSLPVVSLSSTVSAVLLREYDMLPSSNLHNNGIEQSRKAELQSCHESILIHHHVNLSNLISSLLSQYSKTLFISSLLIICHLSLILLISSLFFSSHLISSHLISSHPFSSHLIPSHPIPSYLLFSLLITSHPISSHLPCPPCYPIECNSRRHSIAVVPYLAMCTRALFSAAWISACWSSVRNTLIPTLFLSEEGLLLP